MAGWRSMIKQRRSSVICPEPGAGVPGPMPCRRSDHRHARLLSSRRPILAMRPRSFGATFGRSEVFPPRSVRTFGDGDDRRSAAMISVTSKSRYAVVAMAELARSGERPVPIAQVAERRDMPVQFLEQLFSTL